MEVSSFLQHDKQNHAQASNSHKQNNKKIFPPGLVVLGFVFHLISFLIRKGLDAHDYAK